MASPTNRPAPPRRKIIHVDMDAFYASVEQLDNPSLRGKPVVVGGSPDGRGVVASASYEARRFGIKSALSCAKAKRLCPHVVFVYPNFERYQEVSRQIREIFEEITPKVEPLSLDEAYLDVTENSLGEPLAWKVAMHVKKLIRERTGLTASAGVGPNKLVAKIASDMRKPDGLVVIPPERVADLLERLPVEKLWGVGPATAGRLKEIGIRTAGEMKRTNPEQLERALGKQGLFLHQLSSGDDPREVEMDQERKSIGTETTFSKDVSDVDVLTGKIDEECEEVSDWLIRKECYARTVTLKVRYQDFTTVTRSRTLSIPTQERSSLSRVASELLFESTEAGRVPIRLIGVSLSGLIPKDEPLQLWFEFPNP